MSKSKSGPSATPEGHALYRLIKRCTDPRSPDYANYGGRGLGVCKDWMFGRNGLSKYQAFIEDMGLRPSPDHSIERIDNDKGYYPSNCRWATKSEQAKNKRNNVRISFNGETKVLAEWARSTGLSEATIRRRIARGWPIELALTAPPSPFARLCPTKPLEAA